jgi:tetratricopeptide (TPR) repeat protein
MSPEKRLQQARELADRGHALAKSDLRGAVRAFLASRALLKSIGFMESAAAVVMGAVYAAMTHDDRALAIRLCRLAIKDDPAWADPLSTLAQVETELGNHFVEQNDVPRALRLYDRAAEHHKRAADLLERDDPADARRERGWELFVRKRRAGVLEWSKRRSSP